MTVRKEHAKQFKDGCPECGCPELTEARPLPGQTQPRYVCDHCGILHYAKPPQQPEPRRTRR